MSETKPDLTANPLYAVHELAKALVTGRGHQDPATRARAVARAEQWTRILQGMRDNTLDVGSRTPVAGLPPWVTLEVARGGFATGYALAGGPLAPHEAALAGEPPSRARVNAHYLSDEGRAKLLGLLKSGCYRVEVPEEGALLVLAWLAAHDRREQAARLFEEIAPFLDRLRFHPVPAATPIVPSAVVRLQTVGETLENLREVQTSPRVEVMNEALRFWAPLSDRAVALWLETIDGPLPSVRRGPDGEPVRDANRDYEVEGGLPSARYPEGWMDRAKALLAEYERLRDKHDRSKKPAKRSESFGAMREYLHLATKTRAPLPPKAAARLRRILAGVLEKRGAPGSEKLRILREAQTRMAGSPTNGELAAVVTRRLGARPQDGGLSSIDDLLSPVAEAEAAQVGLPAGTAMPDHLREKLQRSLEAPVEVLVELGVIPSGEVLALVIPQITSQVRAAGLTDPELRLLYGAIYSAFRKRRSLLLLDLSSQVKIEELPWVAALDALRTSKLAGSEQARQTLEQIVALTITSFPEAIIPNKLLQELRALAKGAGLDLPIVDELAADIFMGTFSVKFVEAARSAARLLRGTLYERYYGLPFAEVLDLHDVHQQWGVEASFASLCARLAEPQKSGRGSPVAANGTVIEQEQILTTHNLAVLFEALGLARTLGPGLPELARRCFTWVCQKQQMKVEDWQSRLQLLKNCAYAWRQMIFYLSLSAPGEIERFMEWAAQQMAAEDEVFRACFAPAVEGLRRVAAGGSFDREGRAGEGRRFLGWSVGKHWLMA
ncbi:MAG: hypothetical protein QM820_04345 [Minicystis sp.]